MTAPASATGVILTEAAAAKAKALLDQEGRDDLSLRIAVQPGGCAGLRYQLYFDDRTLDGDKVDQVGGVNLVVDKMSVPYQYLLRRSDDRSSFRNRRHSD